MMNLSVVIPIKDERDNLRPLDARLRQALKPLDLSYEVILVDDGSIDGSYEVLQELAESDARVKVVRLRRNFGQTPALQAGIDHSSGAVLVTMDGDLQNDPADIPALLAQLERGYDAVLGLRANRQDNFLIRKLPSLMANWMIRKVTGVQIKNLQTGEETTLATDGGDNTAWLWDVASGQLKWTINGLGGAVQALIFSLLATVYLYMMLPHEEHGHEEPNAEAHATL